MGVGWWVEHRQFAGTIGPQKALGPPTDREVMRAWEVENGSKAAAQVLSEYEKGTVVILKYKIASFVDGPAGALQVEHAIYYCTIECPPASISDSVKVDRTYTRRLPATVASSTVTTQRP
jgi:hypothetical protein